MWRSAARSIGACLALLCFFAVSSADPSPPSRADVTSGVRVAQRLIDTIPSPWRLDGDVRMAGDDAPVAQGNFVQASYALNKASLDSVATFSRAGNAMQFDSQGYLTYGPNNLLLNTATLGTQTVTVVSGVNYILSIKGTGSVTLTGASTAGPLNGTGASNRVDLKITAATTSLTLTVSGSVTSARLSAVTYETAFRACDDVDNTASAYYGPRFDYTYNGSSWVPAGLLVEGAATNQNKTSADIAGTGWTAGADVTIGAAALAPDGTSTAKLYQSTGAGDFLYNTSVSAIASPFASSVYLKIATGRWFLLRSYGTGGARLWVDMLNGVVGTSSNYSGTGTVFTPTLTSVGGGWYRVILGTTAGATHNYLQINSVSADNSTVQSNGSVYVWGAQSESGSSASSYIPTGASAVTRAAETVQLTGTALAVVQGAQGAVVYEGNGARGTSVMVGSGGSQYRPYISGTSFSAYDGTTALSAAGSVPSNSAWRGGVTWSAAGRSITLNGGAVASDANGTGTFTNAYLGNNNGSLWVNTHIRSVGFYNPRLPDATLQSKSVVNAAY